MNQKFKYEYVDIDEDSTSQYEDIAFKTGVPVKAHYIHASAATDEGNPLIEALPRPLITAQDIRNAYARPMYGYSFDPGKSQFQKLSEIALLDTVRFPLPYHQRLEQENSRTLLAAYRLKEIMAEGFGPVISVGNAFDMAPIGYSLLGASGSGKSSSLRILLSHYPQVIEHNIPGVGKFYQIVYLMVNATPNSNFQALYKDIAKAIDRALGYTEPFYEAMVKPRMSLGESASFISSLLEKFSVGELIIDEIQMMSFNQSKENSYQTLAVLSNNTKTPIVVAGTEEAIEKMFNQQWTSRRIGASIASDLYCSNFGFFKIMVDRLCCYQWGREPQEFSDETKELLYKKTNGVIAYLIMLYSRIQMDIVLNNAEDAFQTEQINRIANFYYAGIEKLLQRSEKKSMKNGKSSELDKTNDYKKELNSDLDQAIQHAQSKQMIESSDKDINMDEIQQYVVDRIKEITDDYNSETIVKAFDVVLNKSLRLGEDADKKKLLRLTIDRLKTGKTDLRPRSHKASPEVLARMKAELQN